MITIGIPTLNGPARLERLLVSLAAVGRLDGARVLVCDDGSDHDQLQMNRDVIARSKLPNLEFISNNRRAGIAASWNRLSQYYDDAEVIALLNDDIEVVDWWLDVLVYSVRENPCAGMVGLNSYVALTKQQHAQIFPAGTLPHERCPVVDYREANLLDGGGRLISAQGPIFAFRRDAFHLAGGFDERYFVYYEECDFAVSLRKKGLYPFMATYPLVYHLGGATNSDSKNLNASEHMARSHKLFVEKWGKTIGELREEFATTYERPKLREWNSQIANWK